MYTGTDACLSHQTTKFLYDYFKQDLHKFDTFDYPENNVYNIYCLKIKKILGLMKNKNNGKIAEEFIGLRLKLYAFKLWGDEEAKKAKGVKISTVKSIGFKDYKCTLHEYENLIQPGHFIRSQNTNYSHLKKIKFLSAGRIVKDS